MERKTHMDAFGAAALIAFALHLAFNQVVIKVTNEGFNPVFAAGARSAGAVLVLLLWMWLRGIPVGIPRAAWGAGLAAGVLFALEFFCLFLALDLTSVSRASVIFYSMPVWLALAAHFLLPGERVSGLRGLGLLLAMAGVALALSDRSGAAVSWAGDLLALAAALCWAAIALSVRLTRLVTIPPAQQLICQVGVSAPLLLLAAPAFGPLLREVEVIHVAALGFQTVAVASLGFLAWFWLMTIYPAASVASFSFLSPVFSVLLGWLLLSENVAPSVWAALVLVAAGIYLINRRPRIAAAG
ncbi:MULTISPECIES: DMT family transporter [unclassified Sulfitobacter]|uniref:DMT family transporter n=1 Tax=unclassified Sulfitobacter TaxID=196795 RepID=UPI0007C2D533|nr:MULTISPECIES: DMT family transporter [unclassified Sulfitobacter]KZY03834.1 multidrug transporter [Sulfitobacter sp. HI0023]KZY23525.1 multidrug transporter [Sulfitobacter sp. HI0040]KZZ62221.1 multidrug transporter [Sulfitobacter sp. HI0129]